MVEQHTYFVFYLHLRMVVGFESSIESCILVHGRIYLFPFPFWLQKLWYVQHNGKKHYRKDVPSTFGENLMILRQKTYFV